MSLIEALRHQYDCEGAPEETRAAADAIEALTAEKQALVEALRNLDRDARPVNWDDEAEDEDQPGWASAQAWLAVDALLNHGADHAR